MSATTTQAKAGETQAKVEKAAASAKSAAKKSVESGMQAVLPDWSSLMALNTRQMEAFFRANEAFLDGLTSMQTELLSLADRRMRAMDEWTKTVATSNGYSKETIESQFAYARTATEQYFETTRNLLRLGSNVSTKMMIPIEQGLREARHLQE